MKKIANRDVQTKGIAFSGISKGVWVALAVLCVINIVMHLFVMPSLPERIPMHWGANGAVDGWGPRWAASAMGALPLGLLFLFYVVPRVDPKGEAYRKSGKFRDRVHGAPVRYDLAVRAFGVGHRARPWCG